MDNPFWIFLSLAVVLLALAVNLRFWLLDRRWVSKFLANRPEVPRLDPPGGKMPGISFVVAAWNEEKVIRRFIQSIFGLSYPNYELVLCAGGNDNTWAIAREFQEEKLILLEQHAGEGKQRSLQRGLEKASGQIIYLVDADCLINDHVLAWTLAPIINLGEQAVSGSLYTPFPEQLQNPFVINQSATRLYAAIHQPAFSTGLLGGNSAVRREALEKAGAFKSEIYTGTDYDLAKRLLKNGFCIRYEMNASIMSEFPSQIGAYYRQQARWVRNVVMHGLRFRAYTEVLACLRTSLVGLGMLLIPIAALGLSFFPGVLRQLAWALLAGWTFGLLMAFFSRLRYLYVARSVLGIDYPIRYLPNLLLYLFLDFVAWAIPLGEYAFKGRREIW